ncbi:Molecular chaperones HSP70/HSC70, HSP70 superfamily [Phaffia rhodozyma]|uniref:ER membrane protein complex subunit 1 n=1 Tax=Phaffia rhodozyma TaxID=264483 RepID=A0A0F7SGE8_PHARH|nr:Molecular chaperones HSP70/HSC70, HSP70 superfamily [Phaffia rhodozyma]
MSSTAPAVLGINFGSSFGSIAVIGKEGHADCIANEDGERQIACAISYNGEQVYIGNGAKPQLVKNSQNTITGFRNLLGKKFSQIGSSAPETLTASAPVISTEDDIPGYKVDILVPPPSATPVGKKSARNTPAPSGTATPANAEPTPQELVLSVPEVTTLYLKTLLQSATDFLGTSPKDGCVIAAPSSFTSVQREALAEAAKAAGINVLQIIDESAAVLVGYRAGLPAERLERGFAPNGQDEEKADKVVVVVDVGDTGVEVEMVAVRQGQYVHLGGGRDETVGGRELNKVLISHFAKEFTKKTKVALPLPISPAGANVNQADLRAQTKLLLAIEHTKRSLSASTGAATCAVESLKDGMDLSASINRLRFDGLAGGVYRKIAEKIRSVVEGCGKNLVQVDEVLLAGSSSLLPGLASGISLIFPEETAITSVLDPSQAIAIGCALQALHLAQLSTSSTGAISQDDLFAALTSEIPSTSQPIGFVLPGSDEFHVVVPADTPLPARRVVALPVSAGVNQVGVEVWEGAESIKIDTIAPPPRDEDDSDSEEEEPEEVASVVRSPKTFLAAVKVGVKASKDAKVLVEVIVHDGSLEVNAWEEGADSDKLGKPLTHGDNVRPLIFPLNKSAATSLEALAITTESGVLASVSLDGEDVYWRHQLASVETIQSYHVADSNIILRTTTRTQTIIRSFSASSGLVRWETSVPNCFENEPVGDISVGKQLILAQAGRLVGLTLDSGDIVWERTVSDDDNRSAPNTLIPGYLLIQPSSVVPKLTAYPLSDLESNSQPSRTFSLPASIALSSLVNALPHVLLYVHEGGLYYLDLVSGAEGRVKMDECLVELKHVPGAAVMAKSNKDEWYMISLTATKGGFKGVPIASLTTSSEKTSALTTYETGEIIHITPLDSESTLQVKIFSSPSDLSKNKHFRIVYDEQLYGAITSVTKSSKNELAITTETGSIHFFDSAGLATGLREEGLSGGDVSVLDLVEEKVGVISVLSRIEEEGWTERVARHLHESLKYLPSYLLKIPVALLPSSSSSASSSALSLLAQDPFNFRKLILVGSPYGKVFALDSIDGSIVWGKRLSTEWAVGWAVLKVWASGAGKVGVVFRGISDGSVSTYAIELNGLDGSLVGNGPKELFKGFSQGILLDSISDSQDADIEGTKPVIVFDNEFKAHTFPPTGSVSHESIHLTKVTSNGSLQGLEVADSSAALEAWRLSVGKDEQIEHVVSAGADSLGGRSLVASYGKVTANKKLLYKYLNPHLLAVVSTQPSKSQATIYLVDSVRGVILERLAHDNVDTSKEIQIILNENWLVYSFKQSVSETYNTPGYRIVSVELYERNLARGGKLGSSELSSYSADHDFDLISRTYHLPVGVKALSFSRTKFGITARDVLVYTEKNQIMAISQRFLDARRPTENEKKEEGLVPYFPVIPLDDSKALSKDSDILGVDRILAIPTLLESTSQILAVGTLDLALTKVQPSGGFDLLPDSFNKLQLVLTILGLSVGIFVAKPTVARKKLKAQWY